MAEENIKVKSCRWADQAVPTGPSMLEKKAGGGCLFQQLDYAGFVQSPTNLVPHQQIASDFSMVMAQARSDAICPIPIVHRSCRKRDG